MKCALSPDAALGCESPVRGRHGAFVKVIPVLASGPSMGAMPLGPLVGSPMLMADNDDSSMARWRVMTTHPLNDGHTCKWRVPDRTERVPYVGAGHLLIGKGRASGVSVLVWAWRSRAPMVGARFGVAVVGATWARAGRLAGRRARAAVRAGGRGDGRALLFLS